VSYTFTVTLATPLTTGDYFIITLPFSGVIPYPNFPPATCTCSS